MKTITLNITNIFEKGRTTRYWREVMCQPQTVDLKSWSSGHPMYTLKGVIINSHDPREIGQETETTVQNYSFWLQESIINGLYTLN